MWSKLIINGLAELPDRSRLLTLDYRDLVACPRESIARFLEFLGLERDPEWEKRVAAGGQAGREARGEVGKGQWDDFDKGMETRHESPLRSRQLGVTVARFRVFNCGAASLGHRRAAVRSHRLPV
jgi:hypothetical protein